MYEKFNEVEVLKNKISILDYLLQRGIKPVTHKANYALFHAPYRQDRNPSCIVYPGTNTFKDMSTGQGGDVIALVMLIEQCDFKTALQKLRSDSYIPLVQQVSSTQPKSEFKILEVKEIYSWPLKKYISSRGISSAVANRYCKEVTFINGNNKRCFAMLC